MTAGCSLAERTIVRTRNPGLFWKLRGSGVAMCLSPGYNWPPDCRVWTLGLEGACLTQASLQEVCILREPNLSYGDQVLTGHLKLEPAGGIAFLLVAALFKLPIPPVCTSPRNHRCKTEELSYLVAELLSLDPCPIPHVSKILGTLTCSLGLDSFCLSHGLLGREQELFKKKREICRAEFCRGVYVQIGCFFVMLTMFYLNHLAQLSAAHSGWWALWENIARHGWRWEIEWAGYYTQWLNWDNSMMHFGDF